MLTDAILTNPLPINPNCSWIERKNNLKIIEIKNTSLTPVTLSDQLDNRVASFDEKISKSVLVEKLQSVLKDNPYRAMKPWSKKLKTSFEKIADTILINKKSADDFSPEFICQDVADETTFISALDREYNKKKFNTNNWVNALKKATINTGIDLQENNYNVLRVLVAKDPLSRLLFATNSLHFVTEIRNITPTPSYQMNPVYKKSIHKIYQYQSSEESEKRQQKLELMMRKKRQIKVDKVMIKAKENLLEQIEAGCQPDIKYVHKILNNIKNFSESEKKLLTRKLTIIALTEEIFSKELTKKNACSTLFFSSDINLDDVFNSRELEKLHLTPEEEKEQRYRLENKKIKIYHDQHGKNIFFRERVGE